MAEVKDFPVDEKVRLEILEQDGILASKGTNVEFIDKTKAEVTTVEVTVSIEGKKQYAVAKVTLSRTDEKAKKVWKEKIEKAKDKKSHLKVKGTSVGGLCDARKGLKKIELLGGCEVAPWMEIVKGELGINEDDDRTRVEEYVKVAKGGGWLKKSEKDFRSSFNVTTASGAWCSCFASWAIAETNSQKSTNFSRLTGWESVPEGARNWINMTFPKKEFQPPIKPPYGTILIMKHISKTNGHATFITNYERKISWESITIKDKEGKKSIKKVKVDKIEIVALGGNQDDKVQYLTYVFKKNSKGKYMKGKQQIYGYVLPKEYVYDEKKPCYYKYEETKGGTSDKLT